MLSEKAMLKVLEKDALETIHGATLEVLRKTGVLVNCQESLEMLKNEGFDVNKTSKIVKMSEGQVLSAVKSCKKNFKIGARNDKQSIEVVDGRTKIGPGAQCMYLLDSNTDQIRTGDLQDGVEICRLFDALKNVSIAYVPTYINGVPESVSFLVTSIAGIVNSSKCTMGGSSGASDVEMTVRLAEALLGDGEKLKNEPLFPGYVDPISPLAHEKTMLDILLGYSRLNQPVFVTVMALAGGTAPASLAGLLVQQNAEILSSIAIAGCVTKSPKIIYGSVSCPLDMRTGAAATGSPEFSLIGAATVQMAKYYGLPSNMGVQSDSKIADEQAAYEKAFSAFAANAAGSDFTDLFIGSTNAFNVCSPVQIVIDDEIMSNATRIARGIEVTEDTLSLDLISRVGPLGNYLKQKETMRQFRREHQMPRLSDRLSLDAWSSAGHRDTRQRAKERLREILRSHVPEPLEPEIKQNLDALLREAGSKTSVADMERPSR